MYRGEASQIFLILLVTQLFTSIMSNTICPSLIKNAHLWKPFPYVNGKFIEKISTNRFDVKNPATGQIITSLNSMRESDVDDASQIAMNAFKSWRKTTGDERGKIIRKMADLMEKYRDDLAVILTLEAGKPLAESKGELIYAQSFYEYYSEEAKRINGEIFQSPMRSKKFLTIKQPIGPVGLITPWNFPSAMITRKVGPALAAGCTVVLKPSEETPLSALALCAIAEEAGLPPGVLNVLPVGREHVSEVGSALCKNTNLRKISFTGSTAVGKLLMRESSANVKRLSLELGGNAPFIVCEDADLNVAISALMNAKFRNAGQACIASNRILVHRKVYNEFAELLRKKVDEKLICGDGFSTSSTLGPLINQQGLQKVARHVEESIKQGASALTGGRVMDELNISGGSFYAPTILVNMTRDMLPYTEETFGPLVPLLAFDSDDEAIEIANDTVHGLAGYVCTNNISRMWKYIEDMEVGMVGVNEGAISSVVSPFGGVKESGIGREGSHYGLEEYLEVKAVTIGIQ